MAGGIKEVAIGRSDVYKLAPEDLYVHDGWNSREDADPENEEHIDMLAKSIASVGVKQPLTVYWEDGKAYITDGHMRYKAVIRAIANGAEIKSIPVMTEDRVSSDGDRIFSQIVRNSGKPLTAIEQAKVYQRLLAFGWSVADIASKAGLSRTRVDELLKLYAAPPEVTDLVKTGQVSATLAISTMKKKGKATAEALLDAVATAKKAGKKKATGKHMAKAPKAPDPLDTEPKAPSKLVILKDIFTRCPFEDPDLTGTFTVTLLADDYAAVRSALKLS